MTDEPAAPQRYFRSVFCPYCGREVEVEIQDIKALEDEYTIPPHEPLRAVNICRAFQIKIAHQLVPCEVCGKKMIRHSWNVCSPKCRTEQEVRSGRKQRIAAAQQERNIALVRSGES